MGRHYLFLTTFLFVKPILIRSLLSHIYLLTLSGIPAKIESDRKRKKSPVVPAEQKEKHNPHLNKTKKMSYCGNSHVGDGGELILIRSPLSDTSLLTLSGIPMRIESDRKRKKCPVVPAEQKKKHTQHLNKTNKISYCSSSDGRDRGEVRVVYEVEPLRIWGSIISLLTICFGMCNDMKTIMTYDIYVQMVEIYNEQFRDLLALDETDNKLEIRSCNDDGLSLPDATFRPVTSTSDVLTLMKLGEVNCAISSTALNNRSSRSHG
ncbi:hypothetical protein Ahy_B06g084010 [Arachis hypogaea]|uniref:Kinesin motor domain-containing protein n=1 Tax=Arachis hypogaea TaxID=3818 RepID=A0A444YQT6_ARAHY|nr:hypothetical protein Ahy_B06g084010 [Arachis hypogaea]